jgi:hypothetical protein
MREIGLYVLQHNTFLITSLLPSWKQPVFGIQGRKDSKNGPKRNHNRVRVERQRFSRSARQDEVRQGVEDSLISSVRFFRRGEIVQEAAPRRCFSCVR